MIAINPRTTLGQFLHFVPRQRRFLRCLGIDPEHQLNQSLFEACRQHDLDWKTFARLLAALQDMESAPVVALESRDLTELCDHLEYAQCLRLRDELVRLDQVTATAVEQAATSHPQLLKIRELFVDFREFFTAHLGEEIEEFFPLIRRMANGNVRTWSAPRALRRRMARLRSEHNQADETLAQLRVLTDRVAARQADSAIIQEIANGIARFEQGLHEQIFEENQILFRRVTATGFH